MKSPRFDTRAAPLRRIFSRRNLEKVWREKVRVAMCQQFMNDGVEYFDFHVARRIGCQSFLNSFYLVSMCPNKRNAF